MSVRLHGFTLIELMIVIAIVGILAAVGVPSYQNYILKARIAEGVTKTTVYKAQIAEFWQVNGNIPTAEQMGVIGADPVANENDFTVAFFQEPPFFVVLLPNNASFGEHAGKAINMPVYISGDGSVSLSCQGAGSTTDPRFAGNLVPLEMLPSTCTAAP